MTLLPDGEQIDYLVYSASDSITEEEKIWDMRYSKVIKRLMFKKFDSWVEGEIIGDK